MIGTIRQDQASDPNNNIDLNQQDTLKDSKKQRSNTHLNTKSLEQQSASGAYLVSFDNSYQLINGNISDNDDGEDNDEEEKESSYNILT